MGIFKFLLTIFSFLPVLIEKKASISNNYLLMSFFLFFITFVIFLFILVYILWNIDTRVVHLKDRASDIQRSLLIVIAKIEEFRYENNDSYSDSRDNDSVTILVDETSAIPFSDKN